MKGALSRVGDKLGISDRARAPQDDPEFLDFEKLLNQTTKSIKVWKKTRESKNEGESLRHAKFLFFHIFCQDLETRVVLFNSSAQKVLGDGEKLAIQCATVFAPFGVGKNGEFARVKEAKVEHEKRHAHVSEQLKTIQAELKRLQDMVSERHKLGAEMQKYLKKASEGDEEKPAEAIEAEAAFTSSHEEALAELRAWKSGFGIQLNVLHDTILELELAFVTKPQSIASSSSTIGTAWIPNIKLW